MSPGAPGDLFMQNKANFRKAKMNENLFAAKDYENETAFRLRKYKPKQSQFLYHWLHSLFIIAAKCC
jgi:penicillin-binding protein-related factor A (putative recombinase)